jgi:hypothetical protein
VPVSDPFRSGATRAAASRLPKLLSPGEVTFWEAVVCSIESRDAAMTERAAAEETAKRADMLVLLRRDRLP